MSYIVLNVSARKTNALQCLGILSAAPVFPAVMLVHALDKELTREEGGFALNVSGVGLVHRHCEPWLDRLPTKGGYQRPMLIQQRGACLFDPIKEPQGNPMQPQALANVEWTLLLDCDATISTQDDHPAKTIRDRLLRMRLAGGVIDHAHVKAFDRWDDALKAALRAGHWIEDATHEARQTHVDPMSAILGSIGKPEMGWIVPANLGYALLESPCSRVGARDDRAHAFAENLVGAIRFVPAGVARQRELKRDDLWRYGWFGDQFLVTNNRSIALSTAMSV